MNEAIMFSLMSKITEANARLTNAVSILGSNLPPEHKEEFQNNINLTHQAHLEIATTLKNELERMLGHVES